MNLRQFLLIPAILLFLFALSCEEPTVEVEELQTPTDLTYDFSGTWILYAWIPIDCPECFTYRYYISGGTMRFDSLNYDLQLHYTFNDDSYSVIEHGTYIHSSYYFLSWENESTMFIGEIQFTPEQGYTWSVQYQITEPQDPDHDIIFKNFFLKNDTTEVMFYWQQEF